jgi:hypothetical protein
MVCGKQEASFPNLIRKIVHRRTVEEDASHQWSPPTKDMVCCASELGLSSDCHVETSTVVQIVSGRFEAWPELINFSSIIPWSRTDSLWLEDGASMKTQELEKVKKILQ